MRTIKFRGKGKDLDSWYHGDLRQYNSKVYIDQFSVIYAVNPDTLGQFIGLLDKNGKEIYEGDIITVNGQYPRVVLWDKMMWALMPTEYYHDTDFWVMNLQHPGPDWWEDFSDEFEIVGNIHDKPNPII